MKDVLIVGRGLAATVLMHRLAAGGVSFTAIGVRHLSRSSEVAAGIWNPVVFKRLTKSWMAESLIPFLEDFYTACSQRLGVELITARELIKPFGEDQEKDLWIKKSKNELSEFLDETMYAADDPALRHFKLSHGYGKVKKAGNLNMQAFLNHSEAYFLQQIVDEVFDYSQLKMDAGAVHYKSHTAKHLVFCEGYRVAQNPFFHWIPLKPAKGEVLTIHAPELRLRDRIFNRNGFMMDLGEQCYKVGATYEWDRLNNDATTEGKNELLSKLGKMVDGSYRILSHEAGIRPSSIDRRPIIGPHPVHANLHVFNGLGTKGVMLAPYLADNFVHYLLNAGPLFPESDVKRFYPLYESAQNPKTQTHRS